MAMFRLNKNLFEFSPCGAHFACALQEQLIVRNSKTLEISQSFIFVDTIEIIGWSPNGQYIFCASTKKAIAQIFSLRHPKWKSKVTEGSAGFENVVWSPDSKALLLISDLNIHISVWTLADQNIMHIWNLKSSVSNIALNEFSCRMAVIVTADGADSVEIYTTKNWKLSRKLMCNKLFGIDGISWSKNGELLAIWCATIGKSRLLIYSVADDAHIGAFSGEDDVDSKIFGKTPYQCCSQKSIRGIEKIVWNPTGQLLVVAGYNETIAIINHTTWSRMLQLHFDPVIRETDYSSRVFKEIEIQRKRDWSNYSVSRSFPEQNLRYPLDEVNARPINIIIDNVQNNYNICVAAIGILEFSPCGKFLVTNHQLYPSTLWIWDLMNDTVDYILLKKAISGVSWDPTRTRILIFSESPIIIEWRCGQKAMCFESPQGIKVLSGKWHPNGETVSLYGYNKTTIIRLKD